MTDPPLVGLVIVSHSRAVAVGTAELARAMAPGVRLVPSGGLDDGGLATDAVAIAAAVRSADAGSGVVLLVDLGGAVLAARTALELLGHAAARVRLSGGPLVEGAVVGAIEASIGGTLEEVLAATESARDLPKAADPRLMPPDRGSRTSAGPGAVVVTVHGDLVDLVGPSARRAAPATPAMTDPARAFSLVRPIAGHPAVKDVIEAVGVPHPEIGALTVDGIPVGLGHRLSDGDRVDAWSSSDTARLGLSPALPLTPADVLDPRFVLDGHLGRLAAYLRMLGFDTWYRTEADDEELAAVAAAEARILLTRDRGLLKRSVVRRGAFVRSDRPVDQLVEVARRFDLIARATPFGRCIRCNAPLVVASREEVLDRLEPLTRIHYDDFRRCPGCGSVYWRGSHHTRMARLIERVRSASEQ